MGGGSGQPGFEGLQCTRATKVSFEISLLSPYSQSLAVTCATYKFAPQGPLIFSRILDDLLATKTQCIEDCVAARALRLQIAEAAEPTLRSAESPESKAFWRLQQAVFGATPACR